MNEKEFVLSAIGLMKQAGVLEHDFRQRYPDTAPKEKPMQYAKLLLDRLDTVIAPFGHRTRVSTSLFQPVEVTPMYPLAIDHFHQRKGCAFRYPIVAVTTTDAIPPFAPPFRYGWFEWWDKGAATGVAVITFDEQAVERYSDLSTPEYGAFAEGARWVQLLIPHFGIAHDDTAMEVDFACLVALDPGGKILRTMFMHGGEFLDAKEAVDQRPIHPGAKVRLIDISAPGVCHMAMFFQALMSCKNVDRIPVDPPPALSKKRVRRGGKPLVRYHRLRVHLPGRERSVLDPTKLPRLGESVVGVHYVRGHFKTYSPERPLLGRATGTFYWPPALRGDAKRGVIGKTYQEVPGEEPASVPEKEEP